MPYVNMLDFFFVCVFVCSCMGGQLPGFQASINAVVSHSKLCFHDFHH